MCPTHYSGQQEEAADRQTTVPAVSCSSSAIDAIDDLEALLRGRGASVEVMPVTSEKISGATATYALGGDKLEFSSWCNAQVSGGVSDHTCALGCFVRSEASNRLQNKEVTSGSLVWSGAGAERDAIYAKPVEGAFIHLPIDHLEQLLAERGFKGDLRQGQILLLNLPDPLAAFIANSTIRSRTALEKWSGSSPPKRIFRYAFDHLLDNFLDCAMLLRGTRYQARAETTNHSRLVKQVQAILHDRPCEIHSVDRLCDSLRVSRRSLQRAFNEVLGVTPNLYLRNWRLARARDDLISGAAGTVTEAAILWGFFDVGRFAGYYKGMFDELPSTTLNRSS